MNWVKLRSMGALACLFFYFYFNNIVIGKEIFELDVFARNVEGVIKI